MRAYGRSSTTSPVVCGQRNKAGCPKNSKSSPHSRRALLWHFMHRPRACTVWQATHARLPAHHTTRLVGMFEKVCDAAAPKPRQAEWREGFLFCACGMQKVKTHNKKGWYCYQPLLPLGAEGESRTPTPLPELDPEPSVSTNSTTSAQQKFIYAISSRLASIFCTPFSVLREYDFFILYFQLDRVIFDRCSASG